MIDLGVRDADVVELMDDPGCDPVRLAATYRRFAVVNRIVAPWGAVYRSRIRPALRAAHRRARVVDLGCGGGDVLRRLRALARRDGLDAEWVGADPDPRAIAAARGTDGIRLVAADAAGLRMLGDPFDVVLSNHVVHHLTADELDGFAEDSRALSRGIVLHGDIARSRLAYALYGIGVLPVAPGTFLRTDGLRSIRRSYHADELSRALGPAWRVSTPAPFRLLAEAVGDA